MTLALTRGMAPETPYLMAAVLSGRRRPRQRPGAKDWLKIAHRLAAGGTYRLRHDIQAEDAIRHAAVQAAAEPPRTTAEGAQHALALQQVAERPIVALRHGLFAYADTGELVELDAAPQEGEPRQAQAP